MRMIIRAPTVYRPATAQGIQEALHALDPRVRFVGVLEVPHKGPPLSVVRKWAEQRRWWPALRAWVAYRFGLEVPPPAPHVSLLVVFKGPFDEDLVREAVATVDAARPAGLPVDVRAWWA
jgi:hypothetical protein